MAEKNIAEALEAKGKPKKTWLKPAKQEELIDRMKSAKPPLGAAAGRDADKPRRTGADVRRAMYGKESGDGKK